MSSFKELLLEFKKNKNLRRLTQEHISKNIFKNLLSYPLMYFMIVMHSAVNVHVNTGANGNSMKAVREGSIILSFERPTSTSQRNSAKRHRNVKDVSRLGVFRDRNQRINY